MPSPVQQLIRRVAENHQARESSDEELLRQFSERKDAESFHALLCRHGPMVLDVCRAVLSHEADVEDAFQATFLVLARKPGSIRKTTSLASWLHGVAYRTALKARAAFAQREKHEARVAKPEAFHAEDRSWGEVQRVLHEELNRLAEGYRAPLVLCYLQGKSQDEAARLLGLAKGTLKGRLERGRALLRTRLARRGLGPAAVLLASAWPAATASARVPEALAVSTCKAASLTAAGQAATTVVSVQVAALAEGVVQEMVVNKMKTGAALAVLVAVLGVGGAIVWQSQAPANDAPARASQKTDEPGKKPQAPAPLEDEKVVEAIKASGGDLTYWKENDNRWTKVEFLRDKGNDDSLKLLQGLRHLQTLNLLGGPAALGDRQFTDAGLAHLKDVKTIRTLNLLFGEVSDDGLAHLKNWTGLEVINFAEVPITGTGLAHLKELPLKTLVIMQGPAAKTFNDAGMAELKGLPKLESLSLASPGITDASLEHLQGMVHLRSLTLASAGISDKGLIHLKALAGGKIEGLEIISPMVTGAGLDHLKGLTSLKNLDLYSTKVTDDGLAKLQGLTKLTGLRLDDTAVTDAGLAHLKAMSGRLEILGLANTQVTDAGLVHLAGLKKLEYLNLAGTKITEAGLVHLRGLTSLKSLTVTDSTVSSDGIGALQKELPKLEIVR